MDLFVLAAAAATAIRLLLFCFAIHLTIEMKTIRWKLAWPNKNVKSVWTFSVWKIYYLVSTENCLTVAYLGTAPVKYIFVAFLSAKIYESIVYRAGSLDRLSASFIWCRHIRKPTLDFRFSHSLSLSPFLYISLSMLIMSLIQINLYSQNEHTFSTFTHEYRARKIYESHEL